jgi:hypothetical protein
MSRPARLGATLKLATWSAVALGLCGYAVQAHRSGQLAAWFYYAAAADGYAVDADTFASATRERPVFLEIGRFDSLDGPRAAAVKKGERLPRGANGVIGTKILAEGKRASLEAGRIKVTVPWEIQQAKGFKFKDTFKHKGIATYPWAAVWNVVMVIAIGLALGLMAEGFTDLLGVKLEKIDHHG